MQFLPGSDGQTLISAGNDGVVSIWDTTRALDGIPKEISFRDDLHSAGIFSLDATESRVLTASKDGCVALSDLQRTSEIVRTHLFDNIHTGVVKYVKWRGDNSFTSCGNDRLASG